MIHANSGGHCTLALIGLDQVSFKGAHQLIRTRHFICSVVRAAPLAQPDQRVPILFFAFLRLIRVWHILDAFSLLFCSALGARLKRSCQARKSRQLRQSEF